MISLSRVQIEALELEHESLFKAKLLRLLRTEEARLGPTPGMLHAAQTSLDGDPLASLMADGLARAALYGLPSEHDRALFVLRDQRLGPRWEESLEYRETTAPLRDPAVAPEDRIARMLQREMADPERSAS